MILACGDNEPMFAWTVGCLEGVIHEKVVSRSDHP
jgi:hypothetical protein